MITPVILFENLLPQVILDNIQRYLPVNDNINEAIKKYYNILYDRKIIDDEYAWDTIVYPNCVCPNCPDNGRTKIYKRKECSICFEYEIKSYSNLYTSETYSIVVDDNPQYKRIMYGEYDDDNSIDDDTSWYNEFWIEDKLYINDIIHN